MIETVHVDQSSGIVGKTVEEIKTKFKIDILYVLPCDKVLAFSWDKKRPRETRKIKAGEALDVVGKTRQITALQKAYRRIPN